MQPNELIYRNVQGNTITVSARLDARVRKIVGRSIVCRSRAAAESLASELRAWGLLAKTWGSITVEAALP